MIGTIAKVLEPLAKYLNSHPNGTVVKIIGEIAAGLIGWKVASKLVIGPMQAMWGTLSGGFGKLKSVWEKAGQAYIKVFGEGGTVSRAGSWIAGLGGKIAGAFSSAWSGISTFGSNLGGWLVNAGQSVASFVGGLASQLGRAVAATGAWIAEHAVATASFIAENVMQAASATAAFIAENAATLGIVAGIAILVAAIVWLATHWHDVWGAIKAVALDVWHNVLDPMWLDIKKGAEWLYNVGIKPYFDLIKLEFTAARRRCPVAVAQRPRPRVARDHVRGPRLRVDLLDGLVERRVDLREPGELPDRHRLRQRDQAVLE